MFTVKKFLQNSISKARKSLSLNDDDKLKVLAFKQMIKVKSSEKALLFHNYSKKKKKKFYDIFK